MELVQYVAPTILSRSCSTRVPVLVYWYISTYLVFQSEGGGESTSMVLKGVEVGVGWKGKGRVRVGPSALPPQSCDIIGYNSQG